VVDPYYNGSVYYDGRSPGLPPPHIMSPQVQHMHFNEKEPVAQLTAPVQENPRTCGMRRRTFFVALIALAVVVIALGVGLGVGLGLGLKKNS